MGWHELTEILNGHEWNDVEFKEAWEHSSKDAYKTVSAFANTAGGRLIFGIRENNGRFEIIGVKKVDKVETEFLSTLHQSGKISSLPAVREEKISDDSRTVLTFFIPEAPREKKPVYLHEDIRQSYIRRGSGDHKCTEDEIKTFLREAAGARDDTELLSGRDDLLRRRVNPLVPNAMAATKPGQAGGCQPHRIPEILWTYRRQCRATLGNPCRHPAVRI